MDRETLQEVVYKPMKDLKQKFYECDCPECWDELKVELKSLFDKAKEMMSADFYKKYRDGIVASIEKIYTYKKKKWDKKQQFTPKKTYLLQDETSEKLNEFLDVVIKVLKKKYDV